MKLVRVLMDSGNVILSSRFQRPLTIRTFSTSPNFDSSESVDDFEQRIFGDGAARGLSSFYQKLDKAEKAYEHNGTGSRFNIRNRDRFMDGQDGIYSALGNRMNSQFKQAATYFEYDPNEVNRDDYTFRPDINFVSGTTYDTKDLNLRKPGVRRPVKRYEFETTTEEVLRKADFRNVRFLANFITEAGIIIKRSKTGISAKAQRKIAREIKTARAFGLLPFTTMGTKRFVFGRTMEDKEGDFEFESYGHSFVDEGVTES